MLNLLFFSVLLFGGALARVFPYGPFNYYTAPPSFGASTISQQIGCTLTAQSTGKVITTDVARFIFGTTTINRYGTQRVFPIKGRALLTLTANFSAALVRAGYTTVEVVRGSALFDSAGSLIRKTSFVPTFTVPAQTLVANRSIVFPFTNATSPPGRVYPLYAQFSPLPANVVTALDYTTLNLSLSSGTPRKVYATLLCDPPNFKYFATTAVDPRLSITPSPELAPDFRPITSLPADSIVFSSGWNYTCTFLGKPGSFDVPISMSFFSSVLSVAKGQAFRYQNGHASVNISRTVISLLQSQVTPPGSAAFFRVQEYNLFFTGSGINPARVNFGATAASNPTKIIGAPNYEVDLPGSNAFFGPITFTAATTGTVATVYAGNATLLFQAINSTGYVLKSILTNCIVPNNPPVPLMSIAIV